MEREQCHLIRTTTIHRLRRRHRSCCCCRCLVGRTTIDWYRYVFRCPCSVFGMIVVVVASSLWSLVCFVRLLLLCFRVRPVVGYQEYIYIYYIYVRPVWARKKEKKKKETRKSEEKTRNIYTGICIGSIIVYCCQVLVYYSSNSVRRRDVYLCY